MVSCPGKAAHFNGYNTIYVFMLNFIYHLFFGWENLYTFFSFHLMDFPNTSLCLVLYNQIFPTLALQKWVTASSYLIASKEVSCYGGDREHLKLQGFVNWMENYLIFWNTTVQRPCPAI